MVRLSNNLIGIVNILTLILSIPIIWAGAWLRSKGTTDCEKFLDTPVIVIGVFLLLVSLAGLIGACCRVSFLLWIYLAVMFLLIVILFCFTVVTFVATNRGAGKVLAGRGYKEYRLGDYSRWLQKRVNGTKNWSRIKSCLVDARVCSKFSNRQLNGTVQEFYRENLSSVQSGCCKPPDSCGFTYVNPVTWMKGGSSYSDADCDAWDNQSGVLCFECSSCKAGLIDDVKRNWRKVAVVISVFQVVITVVYLVGGCAFSNTRRDNSYSNWK